MGVPLTCFPLPHRYACPKPVPGFLTSYVVVFIVFSEWSWEVIASFSNVGGHCWLSLHGLSLHNETLHNAILAQKEHKLTKLTKRHFDLWLVLWQTISVLAWSSWFIPWPLFIVASVRSQNSEWLSICVLAASSCLSVYDF